ncbi:unnamed protein product [Didymodactylos carnosus]|uniref:Uncharacterized protein n=1 Tax=Didymodactylos carnosus TaxID=1234261 RepID=A0A8S2FLV0_9BILA|nr:unnamed protein product [Didymodactylos carnosus]CAF4291305.1 unnamed protein product [Didymodactylos carnosus]
MSSSHSDAELSKRSNSYTSDNNSAVELLSVDNPTNQNRQIDFTSNYGVRPIKVEPCTKEFFSMHKNEAYPMYKMPRGQCLIINVYQINGTARRWSNLDTALLNELFKQLFFEITIYTDLKGHDLRAKNFMEILRQFAQSSKHINSQCCVLCLMSHGEEGSLTAQDGGKIYLEKIFDLFSNVNCPNLAGKPKLFFIQCCRDNPVLGPVDDPGCYVDLEPTIFDDIYDYTNDSIEEDECDSINHLPTRSDMLIGFPSQKGYTAFRKPNVGSWYMNALVDIFSKHSKDTDLCSMMNMVIDKNINGCITQEATNKGKKQTAEFKSLLTKKALYFFPGMIGRQVEPRKRSTDTKRRYIFDYGITATNSMFNRISPVPHGVLDLSMKSSTNSFFQSQINSESIDYCTEHTKSVLKHPRSLIAVADSLSSTSKRICLSNYHHHQSDSSMMIQNEKINFDLIKIYLIENLTDKWKLIAREMKVKDIQIDEIDKQSIAQKQKFRMILDYLTQKYDDAIPLLIDDILKSLKRLQRKLCYSKL